MQYGLLLISRGKNLPAGRSTDQRKLFKIYENYEKTAACGCFSVREGTLCRHVRDFLKRDFSFMVNNYRIFPNFQAML